jgi:glucokinase
MDGMSDLVLVADIGGTNARFALATLANGAIAIRAPQNFRAEDFETVRDAAHAYLESVTDKPAAACLAVAAPVSGDEIVFTNSHWRFHPAEIAASLGVRRFKIVNDFYALAAGVKFLPEDAFIGVKEGTADAAAPVLVIGPGTGLGQALIVPHPQGETLVATEGGHVTFAPRNREEMAVMEFIAREHPRVSVERLLSGRGLVNIHRALCAINDVQRVSQQADEITAAAVDRTYPLAVEAVDLFCAILGRVTGDAVLATGARGGVVLGGGILPKIRNIFLASPFVEKFLDKGRMQSYVAAVPVKLIVIDGAALYGAAATSLTDE